MQTLAETRPKAIQRLKDNGYPYLALLLGQQEKPRDLDKLFGLANNAAHWLEGRHKPSRLAESFARQIFESGEQLKASLTITPDTKEPESSTVLLVVCPPNKLAKLQKIIPLLGGEIEIIDE